MKLLTVVGARPQFIKAAAVSAAIDRHNEGSGRDEILERMIHTGQHYDPAMSEVFFDQLSIRRPSHRLDIRSSSHGAQTGRMLEAVERVILEEQPDAVLVYGDTNSTLAGALAATKLSVPIAHVEAGLRSFVRSMPEEINRVLTDHVSDLLFCPTQTSVNQLSAEGITDEVWLVGDVMLDVFASTMASLPASAPLDGLMPSEFGLVTIHRAANTDDSIRFAAIIEGLRRIASGGSDLVWPVHPRIQDQVDGLDLPSNIHMVEPAPYGTLLALLRDAKFVLTDSGGLQKEAFWSKTPCLTVRDETEWVETIEAGWNQLVPAEASSIERAVLSASPPTNHPAIFGTADASERIVAHIMRAFG